MCFVKVRGFMLELYLNLTFFNKFDNISEKRNCKFVQFDIKDFYPSITENILNNAFDFAKQHVNIDENNLRIIKHCRKSLLFHDNETWKKKTTDSCFDVTMGSFDGAEICELVGQIKFRIISR